MISNKNYLAKIEGSDSLVSSGDTASPLDFSSGKRPIDKGQSQLKISFCCKGFSQIKHPSMTFFAKPTGLTLRVNDTAQYRSIKEDYIATTLCEKCKQKKHCIVAHQPNKLKTLIVKCKYFKFEIKENKNAKQKIPLH